MVIDPRSPHTEEQLVEVDHPSATGHELPQDDFEALHDNTAVQDAVNTGLESPFEASVPHSEVPKKRGRWVVAGLGGAAAAVVAGALAFSGGGDADKPTASAEPTEQSAGPEREQEIAKSPEASKTVGNIDLSKIELGSNYITAMRPNGDEIRVPRLDNANPQILAATALNLYACYLTTGSDECLRAFSDNTEVQKGLVAIRQNDIVPGLSNPANKDMQLAVFDSPIDPAIFTSRKLADGREVVELAGGKLYLGRHINPDGPNEWQGEEIRRFGVLETQATTLQFYVLKNTAGTITINGFNFQHQTPKT